MGHIKGHVIVVDDDPQMRELLSDFLQAEQFSATTFPSAKEALEALKLDAESGQPKVNVVLTDLRMAELNGMDFLKAVKQAWPNIPVILATGHGNLDTAIEAMKSGAYHYIVKPFKLAELSVVLDKAIEKNQLSQENLTLKQEVKKRWTLGSVLGKSQAMQTVFDLVTRVADTTANVLITGESGTGKEIVARAIHSMGPRVNKPFVAINCTAIPETLLESELFGHAKGSFTGAIARKKGLIEEANGGTLFLDEIGDMSPPLQAKLLRVLQERKIRPVGDNSFYDVDVRVIAATHKDLKAAIREDRFREDLFYRLSVIPIVIPPLRERKDDIPILAEHFLAKFSAANSSAGKTRIRGLTKAAMGKMMGLKWEGNVRELENIIERAVVLCSKDWIDVDDIPGPDSLPPDELVKTLTRDFPTLEQLEKRYIEAVLHKTAGRKDKAAQILGINRRTLYRKEREYGWVTDADEPGHSDSSLDAPSETLLI